MPRQERQMRLFNVLFLRGWWDIRGQWAILTIFRTFNKSESKADREEKIMTYGEYLALLELTNPFIEEVELTKNLFPTITVRKGLKKITLHGPDDDLKNITGGEFAMAEQKYLRWHETREDHYLDELIAIFWRPERPDYDPLRDKDIRIPFLPQQIDQLSNYTRRLSMAHKQAIRHFYQACRDIYVQDPRNGRIFNSSDEGSYKRRNYGMLGIFLELGDGVLNMEQVAGSSLRMILIEINRLLDKKEEAEEKTNKSTKQ